MWPGSTCESFLELELFIIMSTPAKCGGPCLQPIKWFKGVGADFIVKLIRNSCSKSF